MSGPLQGNKRWLLVAVVLVMGGLAYLFWPSSGPEKSGMPAGGGAMPVTVEFVEPEAVTVPEELPGRVVPFQVAEVRPQVSGIVTERLFDEGSIVAEGQQLYQIDAATYQAAYDVAVANLEQAKAQLQVVRLTHKRLKKLLGSNAISEQEFDESAASLIRAQAAVSSSEAAVKQAQINVNYTKVYSPISGRIGKSTVTKGALVTANQAKALATVTQLDPVYVDMTQSSSEVQYLRRQFADLKALTVKLRHGRFSEPLQTTGRLQFHEMTVDPTTGSVQMRALFDNTQQELLPGEFVQASLQLPYQQAILVPQSITQRQANGDLTVWLVTANNQAERRVIQARRAVGSDWLITQGLSAGEKLVTSGYMNLQPGAEVMIKAPAANTNAQADQP